MIESARIVVVDDEDAGRFVKTQTLRRAGFTVFDAATGTDGLALVAREAPDVIVLDVNLPDISGLEVARRLRETHGGLPAIQILQISNTAVSASDRVRGLQHGADVYLTEPVEAEVLVATVHALLRVRKAEAALASALEGERRAREQAEEASRLKDEFIATLSHELRTPLNALMGWIWQLQHRDLDRPGQARALQSLERNARMQAQLINDLLDVSRASKGKLQLEVRLIPFHRIVMTAIDSLREAVNRKTLNLRLNIVQARVLGDEARLQQVVTNLVSNSVQFTPPAGRIVVTLGEREGDVVLTVEDTGAGIDPAFLPHVFDQFRQGEGGLSRKHGGLGLGLAVVRQLVELHGGDVSVTSAGRGHGATFVVRLPKTTIRLAESPEAESPLLLDGVNVLVVVDEGVDASTLRALLESSGARVAVTSPSEANAAAQGNVDLVVARSSEAGPGRFRVANRGEWTTLPIGISPVQLVGRLAEAVGLRGEAVERSSSSPSGFESET